VTNLRLVHISKTYSSDTDDIISDFYIPALEKSIEYDRLAGFFSSSSLAVAARGVLGLINNGGTMKLVVSPKLSNSDLDVILSSCKEPEKFIESKMLQELDNLEDEFVRDHVFALGWMLANQKLNIKVAVACDDMGNPLGDGDIERSGLFHQKVGILKDSGGNTITFSGSINETAMGWLGNIEEFKVFRNWEPLERDYVESDISKFDRFWTNRSPKVKVMDVPQAVKDRLIQIAPADIEEIALSKWYPLRATKVKLFQNQEKAVASWINSGMKGIFEMATGTGKTFTALGCLQRMLKPGKKLLTVVTSPYSHLGRQWKTQIDDFGITYDDLVIADSSHPSWKGALVNSLLDMSLPYKNRNRVMVLTTHRTFASHDFIQIIQTNRGSFSTLLIADEVHGLGAKGSRRGLVDEYELRLGLSATPRRWFDDPGTKTLYDYFGGVVYEFSLKDAINTVNPATGESYLTPYRYKPRFVSLSAEELEEYLDKTKAIALKFSEAKDDDSQKALLENLLFKRADIIKNASEKYADLDKVLDEIGPAIKWTIVYCSPQQINTVMSILNRRGIVTHRFTMDEGISPEKKYGGLSERDFLLKEFAEGKYQVLVGMRCLDEGVDIPPARTAILLASSGNPREYVQRIGRTIRRFPGKNEATIYDVIVVSSLLRLPPELGRMEWAIFQKELRRYEEIANIAINNVEALELIYEIRGRRKAL